ncbi:MAG: tetratricopeptide repeat protein, partial [Cyanobacteriota bacterium]
ESPTYNNQVIDRINEVIRLYPQNSEAHYLLSNQYAIVNQYEKAIEELVIYKDLMNINPYRGGPSLKKVDKLMEKYYKIINAKKPKGVIIQQ